MFYIESKLNYDWNERTTNMTLFCDTIKRTKSTLSTSEIVTHERVSLKKVVKLLNDPYVPN